MAQLEKSVARELIEKRFEQVAIHLQEKEDGDFTTVILLIVYVKNFEMELYPNEPTNTAEELT